VLECGLGKDVAEIAVDLAAPNSIAQNEHCISVAVVGAA
jgi:hypothetical protein